MMKRQIASSVAVLLLGISPSFAAVVFEFEQSRRSDLESSAPRASKGKVTIEGTLSRVDYTRSTEVMPGSYVIAINGARMVYVVNPAKKTYTEVDVAGLAQAIGSSRIEVANLKTSMKKLDDHPLLAGYPAEHYRYTATYDMTVMFGALALKQEVETVIDRWVTNIFGDVTSIFVGNEPLRTGNTEIDRIIENETTTMKGFPLRQVVTITTTRPGQTKSESQLKIGTRRQVSEMLVTSIQQASANPSIFQIPPTYRKVDPLEEVKKEPGVHMLSMDTEGQLPPQKQ